MKTPSAVLLGSIAVVVYALANVAHEGSHGIACVLVGGKPLAFSATYFECDKDAVAESLLRWIPAAGSITNVLLAALAWFALGRFKGTPSNAKYFWWLFFTVNALQAAGYWMFSGLGNVGDWSHVIDGLEPRWIWRVLLAVVGSLAYVMVIRVSLLQLGAFVMPGEAVVSQARRLALIPYLTGGVLYVAAGLLNPLSWKLVLISAAAASFGGTSALAWMFRLGRQPQRVAPSASEAFAPGISVPWMAAALVIAAIFIGVLGPAISF